MLTNVVEPRHRWLFPDPGDLDPEFAAAARRHDLSATVASVLVGRGLTTAADLDAFFAEPGLGLHDPLLLPDAERARERVQTARGRGERVMVFGDFDADGLTGLAILIIALRRLGLDCVPYVPDRLDEGHGLSLAAIEHAGAGRVTLIVTVDCGTTSVSEVEVAARAGIDVIVTDHHRVPDVLPPAVAVVNPQRPDSRYPDRRLAGSGVAFAVARLLLADEPGGAAAALALADLATIGTVADVAPILGENRAIARHGLSLMRSAPRPGLVALFERAGVAPSSVDLETVAFAIAPRLNAAGRVGEAAAAARLLLAEDAVEAATLAAELEAANSSRRDLTRTVLAEARSALGLGEERPRDPPAAAIIRGPWPVGLVGLVASRLVDELGRPAVVGADLGPVVRASCRSDGALDLAAALSACGDLFTRYGGHAGAAGFELPTERWETFRERFLILAAATAPADPRPTLRIDVAIPASGCDYRLHGQLARLAPTGPGNPDPLVAVLGLTVTRVREATGGHTQLVLRRELDVLDGIAFDRPDLATVVSEGDRVDVVGRLMSRRFGGFESLQIEIRDVAPAGWHPESAAILGMVAAGGPPIVAAAVPA
jgi:single-stranded-DNA-specific exonuclease